MKPFEGFVYIVVFSTLVSGCVGIGVNWGTQSTHPLPPATVVKMLRDNGIQKLKLFDADHSILSALGNSGIQVMVGIPNDMLYHLATNSKTAHNWVSKNLSSHVSNGVDVRYVAVGNEPFLSTYNGSFLDTTFPALQNIQAAITSANLGAKVKVTIPLNADVYNSSSSLPSTGDFRAETRDRMLQIVKFLSENGAPFTVNIYPFISLHNDINFPLEYAMFDGFPSPINDNGKIYQNVLDANHDTLVWALQKNGFGNLPIIVGEIGWPTDGDRSATVQLAQRFNQGFMTRYNAGTGTPMRPGAMEVYLFSLIDEDFKSIQPGYFERHWGLFYFDGTPKYQLNLGTTSSNGLVPASDVRYMAQQWCVLSQSASLDDPQVAPSVSYACALGDCTSLGDGSSCGNLDDRGNVSYAFNSYYQINNQLPTACRFPDNISVVTNQDPSTGDCKFRVMIDVPSSTSYSGGDDSGVGHLDKPVGFILFVLVSLSMIL